jgi:anti-sigma B factor antagonist
VPILTRNNKGVLALQIEGDMTINTAAALKKELMEYIAQTSECEIVLSDVSKMDSAGMQLLIMAKREATRRNTPLRLIGHSKAVRDVMETYNMTAYFEDPISMSEGSRV